MSFKSTMPQFSASLQSPVFISPEKLHELTETENGVTILHARSTDEDEHDIKQDAVHAIPGAVDCLWSMFIRDDDCTKLKSIDEMAQLFRVCGVCNERPVVVIGSWNKGFGEEGRIYWHLVHLGHSKAFILNGGLVAWRQSGLTGKGRNAVGDFSPCIRNECRALMHEIEEIVQNGLPLLIDCRSIEEYHGKAVVMSHRRGRIPQAIHYDWYSSFKAGPVFRPRFADFRQNVFETDGSCTLRNVDDILKELRDLGVDTEQHTVVYCGRGVRSAFLWAVLHSKMDIANYDGSFHEWAARLDLPIHPNSS